MTTALDLRSSPLHTDRAREGRLSNLIGVIYDAAIDPALWQAVFEGAAQFVPACDEENECCEEQQEFGEGRRQKFDRGLHPFKFRHLEWRRRKGVGGAKHAFQLVPKRQRAIEDVKLVFQQPGKFRQAVGPLHDRR